ncbi:MAG: hypothetical protein LC122_14070 [Chitinophagales bacterium]|nr:hypothetical protein [Chitinophagales bacterium]
MKDLEKQFLKDQQLVQDKIKEAAKLIKEASTISRKYIDISDYYDGETPGIHSLVRFDPIHNQIDDDFYQDEVSDNNDGSYERNAVWRKKFEKTMEEFYSAIEDGGLILD